MSKQSAVHEVTVEHTDEPGLLVICGAVADNDGTIRILDRHGYEHHYESLGYPSVDSDGRTRTAAHYVGGIDDTDPNAEFEYADGREPEDPWGDTVTVWKRARITYPFLLDALPGFQSRTRTSWSVGIAAVGLLLSW